MKTMSFHKYRPYEAVHLPSRTWPTKAIAKAPRWCSVDLRDGNQALSIPMGIPEKMTMFRLLTAIGFKEIEIGFPSAAEVEFEFTRQLIEGALVPEDVAIQVLVPARESFIRRTFEAVRGAKKAVVHLYNSTSEVQRRVVFGKDRSGIVRIATDAAALMKKLRQEPGMEGVSFEYTPESFHGTEPEFVLDICHAVMDIWQPSRDNKVIINLPSTVEACTPNVYADRIEWFSRHVKGREKMVLSVHTHNDRGCAVAAAELAVMAGAERVEGALFGNGERTGNMDIVTMAMNLFSQGVDPELDFSDIDHVRTVYTQCTQMEVPPRHPYAGDLVYTAFSGSHQDAINKGFKAMDTSPDGKWEVPYLPIDPRDVGRDYEAVIRINSQSGKGGVAYILEKEKGLLVPKFMQAEVAAQVQRLAEKTGRELTPGEIVRCFETTYVDAPGPLWQRHIEVHDAGEGETIVKSLMTINGKGAEINGKGNGPVEAFVNGMTPLTGEVVDVILYAEHALGTGAGALAVAYLGIRRPEGQEAFGVGIDPNISTASIKAVVSAINRCWNSAGS